ncbi:hypothetical protein FGG78_09190 [Thioclava sp. BHET1]|nr:hypothetical protein FGG78_09190 [Thioclava sp. BHET1]
MKRNWASALVGLTIGLAVPMGAWAQTIRVTVTSGYSPTAAWVKEFQDVFVPAVNESLSKSGNTKIDWNLAWGTVTKPAGDFDAVQNGLSDMAIVQTVFHPDKVGVYNISYVTPFVSTDIDKITNVVNGLVTKYPSMTEVWQKYDQHILTTLAGVDNYQIILRDPVSGPKDLKGRKICGAGLNLRYVEGSGVVGVPSPLSDWYNNIRSGICDGTIVWPEAIQNFKLYEVAPYLVDISFGGVNSMALTVNARKWKSYPPEVQKAFETAAETYRHALATYAMTRSAESIKAFKQEGGKVIPVSTEQRKSWADSLPPIAALWVTDQDARGIPAKKILDSYLDGMRALGAKPLRDWSE